MLTKADMAQSPLGGDIEHIPRLRPAPAPECRACDGRGDIWRDHEIVPRACARCDGTRLEPEVCCWFCASWHDGGALVLHPDCDEPMCRACAGRLDRYGWCVAERCLNIADRCVDGMRVCAEHAP
jgi:hypothetical protein